MTDIVERLRDCHRVFKHKDIAEAADEIERLRGELQAATEWADSLPARLEDEAADEIERLRELFRIDGEQHTASVKTILHDQDTRLAAYKNEIERLRATLKALLEDPPPTLDEPDTDAEVIIKMRAIALHALRH